MDEFTAELYLQLLKNYFEELFASTQNDELDINKKGSYAFNKIRSAEGLVSGGVWGSNTMLSLPHFKDIFEIYTDTLSLFPEVTPPKPEWLTPQLEGDLARLPLERFALTQAAQTAEAGQFERIFEANRQQQEFENQLTLRSLNLQQDQLREGR